MRTVILGERPPAIEALIESRRRTGADRRDEIWDGDYHMNPAPRKRHGRLVHQLGVLLDPYARRAALFPTADFNLGVPNDYRIPDGGLHRDDDDAIYVDTAAMAIEILSPDDETWDKVPFYAAHGVDEVVVVDPATRTVTWLRLTDGDYRVVAHSELLDVAVAEFSALIDWPPVD
jgi:Uma2 family endonuclease